MEIDFVPTEEYPNRVPFDVVEGLQRFIKGKVVCDLGCGGGDLLMAASKYASQVVGVERDPTRYALAKSHGLSVINGDFTQRGVIPKADVYFLWAGLEVEQTVVRIFETIGHPCILFIMRRCQNAADLAGFTQRVIELDFKEEVSVVEGWELTGKFCAGMITFNGFSEPSLQSSYFGSTIGETLYKKVRDLAPVTIVECGVLKGYSTICMAQALRELGGGKIIAYDMWETYEHGHGQTLEEVQQTVDDHGLSDYVELRHGNFYDNPWKSDGINPDLMHVDINNTGEILPIISALEFPVMFEGGSAKRDDVWWMVKFEKTKMYPLKDEYNYSILNDTFPSISIINND